MLTLIASRQHQKQLSFRRSRQNFDFPQIRDEHYVTVVFDLDESDIRKKTFTFDSNQNEHRSVKNQEFNHVEYQTSVKNVYFPQQPWPQAHASFYMTRTFGIESPQSSCPLEKNVLKQLFIFLDKRIFNHLLILLVEGLLFN